MVLRPETDKALVVRVYSKSRDLTQSGKHEWLHGPACENEREGGREAAREVGGGIGTGERMRTRERKDRE